VANPQTENGYTRIANELYDHIGAAKFTATQLKVILCIMRYTYGFNRKSHRMTASFVAKWAGCSLSMVKKELIYLTSANVISIISRGNREGNILAMNKDFESWKVECAMSEKDLTSTAQGTGTIEGTGTVDDTITGTIDGTTPVPQTVPKKRQIKDNIKNNNISAKVADEKAEEFFETIWKLLPPHHNDRKRSVGKTRKRELQKIGFERVKAAVNRYLETQNPAYYHRRDRFMNEIIDNYLVGQTQLADVSAVEERPGKLLTDEELLREGYS